MDNPVKSFLLGRWLGHPLHPAVVHVPIALWLGALLFDVLTQFGIGGNALVRTAFYGYVVGLISTLIVVPAGIAEWTQIKREKPAWKLALWHAILNVAVTLLVVVTVTMRTGAAYDAEATPTGALAVAILACVILMVSGYLGGRMVFDHGIGVARMSKKKWRAIAAASGANLPPEK